MKRYLKIFTPLALIILTGVLSVAFAQTRGDKSSRLARGGEGRKFGRPPGPPPGGAAGLHPKLLQQLDLTDEQKEQIKALHQSTRTNFEASFEQMKTFQEQLKAATQDGNFNEAQVRQILTNRAQLSIELEVARLKTDAAILNLLTAEQKARLEQLKQAAPPSRPEGFRPPPPPQN